MHSVFDKSGRERERERVSNPLRKQKMASSSRRDDGDSPLPAKVPTFFKIVLDKALRDGRLVS